MCDPPVSADRTCPSPDEMNTMKKLSRLAFAVLTCGVIAAQPMPATAETAAKTTHLLAVAVCPPWKTAPGDPDLTSKWAASCRNDVSLMSDALRKSMQIRDENTTLLVDAAATYSAVSAGFKQLAGKAQPADRVIIFMNTHGGEVDASYNGYALKDEVFALYSKQEPGDFRQATADDLWMTARALRDLIDGISAEEIVVILESCHSAASYQDFRYDLGRRYSKGWKGREAIIFSAGADQIANFTEGNDKALFTKVFSEVLAANDQANLGDAFQTARIETQRDIRKRCLTGPYADKMQLNHEAFLTYCTQLPTTFDPYGLLDDIKLRKLPESGALDHDPKVGVSFR